MIQKWKFWVSLGRSVSPSFIALHLLPQHPSLAASTVSRHLWSLAATLPPSYSRARPWALSVPFGVFVGDEGVADVVVSFIEMINCGGNSLLQILALGI